MPTTPPSLLPALDMLGIKGIKQTARESADLGLYKLENLQGRWVALGDDGKGGI